MYLQQIKLHNFRKYGSIDDEAGLTLELDPGMNILVGENDSGKSCVIDAIQLVLFDESHGWLRIDDDDFYPCSDTLRIECEFSDITDHEARNLLEWFSFDEDGSYRLRVVLRAERRVSGIWMEIKAGPDQEGAALTKEARRFLCATYLKPLRDAEKELSPGRRSRLARILGSHPAMSNPAGGKHPIVDAVGMANDAIRTYFGSEESDGHAVFKVISNNLESLRREGSGLTPHIDLDTPVLQRILEKLTLGFGSGSVKPGLGSQNLLFIAAELLMLKQERDWLKLALVEELEAHLDPQAQLRVMQFLEKEAADNLQLIVSTHSPILASAAALEGLTIFRNGKAFPMHADATKLNPGDYAFLRRFLDATKSNLFFATGVIIVEGPSENLLFPILAKIVTGNDLAKYGVSIVNVGSTALLRYAKIFHRADGTAMGIPVACVTDRDIPPAEAKAKHLIRAERKTEVDFTDEQLKSALAKKREQLCSQDVALFVSPGWTLEFDLALSGIGKFVNRAVRLAEATDTSSSFLTPESTEYSDAVNEADADYDTWQSTLSPLNMACEIYAALAKKRASKAAAAEYLAQILEAEFLKDAVGVRKLINGDIKLSYLVGAIKHVTGTK